MNSDEILIGFKGEPQESGIIFLDYIPTIRVGRDNEYDVFMNQYHKNHALCPKCHSKPYSTTYVGYILHMDKKDQYKDRNRCICSNCGDVHTTHDRIPE